MIVILRIPFSTNYFFSVAFPFPGSSDIPFLGLLSVFAETQLLAGSKKGVCLNLPLHLIRGLAG